MRRVIVEWQNARRYFRQTLDSLSRRSHHPHIAWSRDVARM